MKKSLLFFFLFCCIFLWAEDNESSSPISIDAIISSASSYFEAEEESIESEIVNLNVGVAESALEGLLSSKTSSTPASIAPKVAGPIIGSHRLGAGRTVGALSKKYKAPGADKVLRVLYSAYEIISQTDGSSNAVTIIFAIVGQIIKEVLSELLEQMIDSILVALEVPPGIREIIGGIISEVISYFLINPAVDELLDFAQDIVS